MKSKYWWVALLVLRILLAVIFIYAAIGKIIGPTAFAADIDNYRLLPYILVTLVALILPWLEVICGLLLIIGRWLSGASLLVMGMNAVFIIAIASAILRGLDISCGCFSLSQDGSRVGLTRLAEDAAFFLAAWFIYREASHKN